MKRRGFLKALGLAPLAAAVAAKAAAEVVEEDQVLKAVSGPPATWHVVVNTLTDEMVETDAYGVATVKSWTDHLSGKV